MKTLKVLALSVIPLIFAPGQAAPSREAMDQVILEKVQFREASFEGVLRELERLYALNAPDGQVIRFQSKVEAADLMNAMLTTGDKNIPFPKMLRLVERFFGVRFENGGEIIEVVAASMKLSPGREAVTVRKVKRESRTVKQFGNTDAFVDELNTLWAEEDFSGIREAIESRLKETDGKDIAALLAKADYEMGYAQAPQKARQVAKDIQTLANNMPWRVNFGYAAFRPVVEAYLNPEKVRPGDWTFDWDTIRAQGGGRFPSQGLLRQVGEAQYRQR